MRISSHLCTQYTSHTLGNSHITQSHYTSSVAVCCVLHCVAVLDWNSTTAFRAWHANASACLNTNGRVGGNAVKGGEDP